MSVIVKKAPKTDVEHVVVKKQNKKNLENNTVGKSKKKLQSSFDDTSASSHCDKKSTTIESNVGQNNVSAKQEASNIDQSNAKTIPEPINTICIVNEPNKTIGNDHIKDIININIPTNETTTSGKRVENLGLSKELSENLANEKDLSDELFGNFPLPQTPNESNPNALSPTAAFLLSFPVVSTVSNSKPTETDNSYSVGTNLLRLEDKQNQPKDHSLFESISFILNDLNDVSDGKNISNVENSNTTQYPYCTNKPRTNIDSEKSNTLNSVNNANRKKNLNINNLLNDDRMRENQSTSKSTTNDVKKHPSIPECSTNTMQTNNLIGDRTNFMQSKTFENVSNENASDFYVSLSTLGLPLKSAATLASTPSINPSSHFNFQISSLAPRNLIESRPLIADTPFTFSLTKCSETITNTTKTISQQSDVVNRSNKITPKKSSPTKHLVNDRFIVPQSEPTSMTSLNRCNTFNPFSFDNPSILSSTSSIGLGNLTTVSSSTSSSITSTPFTFTLTPTFSSISASTPLVSNHDPLFSSSFDMPIMRSTNALTKNSKKASTVPHFADNEKELQTQSTLVKSGKNYAGPSTTSKPSKNLVNWMTSSVNNKTTQELHLDFISTAPEEPSQWSPNRMNVDNTNLISSSALPMLHGDLALNTISNLCNGPSNKFDLDSKKTPMRTNTNHKYGQSKASTNRKAEHHQQIERNGKISKNDKNLQNFKTNHQTIQQSVNESHTTNKFHSVSQLLDQERQTANKNNSCYIANEGKMLVKDGVGGAGKLKTYPKYEMDTNENRFATNSCNIVNNSEITGSNECDRDLFGSYFFSQPKRLKLNYHTSTEYLGNQSYPTAYDNSNANDHLAPYANYQTYDNDCNNVSATSCINNLSNQTYSYQYVQPPPSSQPHSQYNQQTQQQPQIPCDPIDSSANYFQAPPVSSLPNYKPSSHYDVIPPRSTTKTSTHQSFLHQTKANEPISNAKLFTGTSAASGSVAPMNRNTSTVCPSKTIHYPSHSNINNLQLNQTTWNDSFSWMPYTNSIDKPYNNNLFNSTESSTIKTVPTNNISGNNNMIPNFNLTTIFPDYNKS